MPEHRNVGGLREVFNIHLVPTAITSILPYSLGINVDVLHLIYTTSGISL